VCCLEGGSVSKSTLDLTDPDPTPRHCSDVERLSEMYLSAMNAARIQVELLMNRLWQLDLAVSWVSPSTGLSSRSRSVDCMAEARGANPSLPAAPLVPLSLSRACQ